MYDSIKTRFWDFIFRMNGIDVLHRMLWLECDVDRLSLLRFGAGHINDLLLHLVECWLAISTLITRFKTASSTTQIVRYDSKPLRKRLIVTRIQR